jgi:hypothetical protein
MHQTAKNENNIIYCIFFTLFMIIWANHSIYNLVSLVKYYIENVGFLGNGKIAISEKKETSL